MNVYINLSVADLARSRAFFSALGFGFNDMFSDHTAIAMVLSDKAGVMLVSKERFKDFTPRTIADAAKTTEALVALQLESREEVDAMVKKALAEGGSPVSDPVDHGFMYEHSFADPDGHIFNPFVLDMAMAEAAR